MPLLRFYSNDAITIGKNTPFFTLLSAGPLKPRVSRPCLVGLCLNLGLLAWQKKNVFVKDQCRTALTI